jgi:hypothetical protein
MRHLISRIAVSSLAYSQTERIALSILNLRSIGLHGVNKSVAIKELRKSIQRHRDRGILTNSAPAYRLLIDNTNLSQKELLYALECAFVSGDRTLIKYCARQIVSTINRKTTHSEKDNLLKNVAMDIVQYSKKISNKRNQTIYYFLRCLYRSISNKTTRLINNNYDLDEFSRLLSKLFDGFINAGWIKYMNDLEYYLPESLIDSPHIIVVIGKREKWSYELQRASHLFRIALNKPNCDPEAYFELAETLEFIGDDAAAITEAEHGFSHLSREELFAKSRNRLTMTAGPKLRLGDFVGGWTAHMNRRDRFLLELNSPRKFWQGPKDKQERIIVFAESGVGDELKYASCYGDLASRVTHVFATADPRLIPLLKRSFPNISFIGHDRQKTSKGWGKKAVKKSSFISSRAIDLELSCLLTAFSTFILSGDLPYYFRRSRDDFFSSSSGYLITNKNYRDMWRYRLRGLGPGLKVGISWRSQRRKSKTIGRNQHYFKLSSLKPILNVKGVHFINLQYDEPENEINFIENDFGVPVHRWNDVNIHDDFESVAALMRELDVIIAPHNMVKELAGAVGARTLFMVSTGQAWVRWRADPTNSKDIWHPSVEHLHSTYPGEKNEVIEMTKSRLETIVREKEDKINVKQHKSGYHIIKDSCENVNNKNLNFIFNYKRERINLITNEYGESFQPAGIYNVINKTDRDREWRRRQRAFDKKIAELFQNRVQPSSPEGVLLILGQSHKQYAMTVLAAHRLLDYNWAAVCLDQMPYEFGQITNQNISFFKGRLVSSGTPRHRLYAVRGHRNELQLEWEIDLPKRICRAKGINFYGTIFNRLCKEFRRYISDISDPEFKERFDVLLLTCDAALTVCLEAEERLAGSGMQVRFTGWEQDYPPTGALKVYCHERGYKYGIEFVEISQSYENYFGEGKYGLIKSIDCQNITRNNLGNAWTLRGDKFYTWYKTKGKHEDVIKQCRQWAFRNRREAREIPPQGRIVLDRIREQHYRGGKVACLYGSVPYDFGTPWIDSGPAHYDRRDWYNHTVAILSNTKTLLLIKPHPDEAKSEFMGIPNQYFIEMLDKPPAENVIILGHNWLNNSDLIPELDFGIVWRGSVAVELALMGIPVVTCNPRSMAEQVLDFPQPKCREDYEDMLRHPERLVISDELKERASVFFGFYWSEVMIPYPFAWISQKLKFLGPPVWSNSAIREYLEVGHPSIDEMCNRIISP